MDEFLTTMSNDMGIDRYEGESDDSFIYRLCYSSLGQWCLHIAQNSSAEVVGTTKHNQTIVMNELLQRYIELFPGIVDKFINVGNSQASFPVHIRRVYEETGYLLTDENNRNRVANFGRTICVGNTYLFVGIPHETFTVNGLGVFASPTKFLSSAREFLIRDGLTCEEYFQERYDTTDFYERDIGIDELQFFNPMSTDVPSRSWSTKMIRNCSVAREGVLGPFYRVLKEPNNSFLFADEIVEPQSDSLTSYEYRRLYFAIKAHYNNPLKAWVERQDRRYSRLKIGGHLPNREYYYLLLLSWPLNNAFDRANFLIKNDFIPGVADVLGNIGIIIKGGSTYV